MNFRRAKADSAHDGSPGARGGKCNSGWRQERVWRGQRLEGKIYAMATSAAVRDRTLLIWTCGGAAKRGLSVRDWETLVRIGVRGGPGRTRTINQNLTAPALACPPSAGDHGSGFSSPFLHQADADKPQRTQQNSIAYANSDERLDRVVRSRLTRSRSFRRKPVWSLFVFESIAAGPTARIASATLSGPRPRP